MMSVKSSSQQMSGREEGHKKTSHSLDKEILTTMVLGVVGSFAGGFISSLIFRSSDNLMNPAGWIMSIVGALIVLLLYGKISKAKT